MQNTDEDQYYYDTHRTSLLFFLVFETGFTPGDSAYLIITSYIHLCSLNQGGELTDTDISRAVLPWIKTARNK